MSAEREANYIRECLARIREVYPIASENDDELQETLDLAYLRLELRRKREIDAEGSTSLIPHPPSEYVTSLQRTLQHLEEASHQYDVSHCNPPDCTDTTTTSLPTSDTGIEAELNTLLNLIWKPRDVISEAHIMSKGVSSDPSNPESRCTSAFSKVSSDSTVVASSPRQLKSPKKLKPKSSFVPRKDMKRAVAGIMATSKMRRTFAAPVEEDVQGEYMIKAPIRGRWFARTVPNKDIAGRAMPWIHPFNYPVLTAAATVVSNSFSTQRARKVRSHLRDREAAIFARQREVEAAVMIQCQWRVFVSARLVVERREQAFMEFDEEMQELSADVEEGLE